MHLQQLVAKNLELGQFQLKAIAKMPKEIVRDSKSKVYFYLKVFNFISAIIGIFYLIILSVLCVLLLNKNYLLEKTQEEIADLKKDVQDLKLKSSLCVSMQEIKDFEQESNDDQPDLLSDVDEVDDPDDNFRPVARTDSEDYHDDKGYFGKIIYAKKYDDGKIARNKREILASTKDGVPIVAEPYLGSKVAKKHSSGEKLRLYDILANPKLNHGKTIITPAPYVAPTQRSFYRTRRITSKPTPILSRSSRVMNTANTNAPRRIRKKSVSRSGNRERDQLENKNFQEQVESLETTIYPNEHRRHRRPAKAFHVNGDTSRHDPTRHRHYEGNGRLKHPHGYVNWTEAPWVKPIGFDRFFSIHNGIVTVEEEGLYYIYAQISYSDVQDQNGFKIMKNTVMIGQCTVTSVSANSTNKTNSCFTGTIEYLAKRDQLKIKDMFNDRTTLFEPGKSFFGLFKISDLKMK